MVPPQDFKLFCDELAPFNEMEHEVEIMTAKYDDVIGCLSGGTCEFNITSKLDITIKTNGSSTRTGNINIWPPYTGVIIADGEKCSDGCNAEPAPAYSVPSG